jgi:hypothetical protein
VASGAINLGGLLYGNAAWEGVACGAMNFGL